MSQEQPCLLVANCSFWASILSCKRRLVLALDCFTQRPQAHSLSIDPAALAARPAGAGWRGGGALN